MRGLKELMAEYSVPFVKIVSGNSFKLGSSGAVTLQFLDGLGNAVSAEACLLSCCLAWSKLEQSTVCCICIVMLYILQSGQLESCR